MSDIKTELASREVIEKKLLTSLEDADTVAVLLSKKDLEAIIPALDYYNLVTPAFVRIQDINQGLIELYQQAFT